GAERRVLLAQRVERGDDVRVKAGAELGARERQQDLRVVLEQARARLVADAHGLVVAAGRRQLVGETARRVDAAIALVIERAFAHAPVRVHGVAYASQR